AAAATCLILAAGCGGDSDHSTTAASGLSTARADQLRRAVLEGARTDFKGTRVQRRYSCFLPRLRRALTGRELGLLVKVYRERGQAFAAQTLNALAAPAGDACGGRRYVPELVEASKGLRRDVSAGKGSARLAVQYGPDIGVACRQPNSVRCNRLGFHVVLRKRATHVSVSIAGLPV